MAAIAPVRLKHTRDKELDGIRERLLEDFLKRLQEREGNNLLRVVLFGSVARGEAGEDSDIDILVLVKDGQGLDLLDRIVGISVEADLEAGEYRTHLSPLAYGLEEFNERQNVVPFFWNIEKDGVIIYDTEDAARRVDMAEEFIKTVETTLMKESS